MIDLHADDLALGEYVVAHYRHLSPPASPGLRMRMGQIDADEARRAEGDRAPLSWLDTPADALSPEAARDRARGALLGMAAGDAVGTTLEFQPRDAGHVHDMVGGGPFRLAAGEWTDDTTMALCLADAIIADGEFNPASFARLLVRWYRDGLNSVTGHCFDIGNATRTAVEGHEAEDFRWRGNTSDRTAGNGSLVRVAPVAIAWRGSLRQTWYMAAAQSRVTHGAMDALACCQIFAMQMHHALRGAPREAVLAPMLASLTPRAQIINAGEYKSKTRDQIRSSGYVVDTLEAALWSIWNSGSFEEAVLLAANLGDDADSVACVAGQLAGAIYGLSAIPPEWLRKLAWRDALLDRADRLLAL
ncbi:ADP-ribosylarginine hydrolase Tri1 [Longimicrobium terrae]|uniref:ADP-ribosyl-[dinitrogen reductase] hydrolase n=1 Tax=Longimicrobium terrae TaxID=1639882 RepID=A0A841H098_9BACT|nr:ADP-ribosylarginine hydrolase Tri1 [Longimicrobium terrae]MBB4637257.1 ADP-ribosyl-[dinitrogen reductase] hydrolase [Longimicrobium terrae]MBB6071481.1 ADP-ribosyl-[dinitrogen reductase] hydrolase [Longimicrobium terrae]NNC30096.1 ADP-ribosylglycohydrolase family protein [Longimicrobium terrae]